MKKYERIENKQLANKEEVLFQRLREMDYVSGVQYLISCGYEKNGSYEEKDNGMVLVSEYWKMTLPESDFYYDPDESDEYNSSIISWEYKLQADQSETEIDKLDGYWNEISSVGEE